MTSSFAITANGVTKCFGTVQALAGLRLEVPAGTIFGLLGENGAGKTTFIKVLLDIARADAGDITVLGEPPGSLAARRRIGYLPENLQLPPAFSALAFLRAAGRIKGLSRADREDQIRRVLKLVGLEESFWNKRTSGYSKGMRQRTGLAAALLGKPDLLILDEPTDGIDPLGRAELREVIREAARRGATIFLNSHLLAETEKIADHVAVLSKGRVAVSGALDILRADDRFLVRFAAGDTVVDVATRHGFSPAAGEPPIQGSSAWLFADSRDDALSRALHSALSEGLRVREVRPLTKDLEAVMAEAVRNSAASEPEAS